MVWNHSIIYIIYQVGFAPNHMLATISGMFTTVANRLSSFIFQLIHVDLHPAAKNIQSISIVSHKKWMRKCQT